MLLSHLDALAADGFGPAGWVELRIPPNKIGYFNIDIPENGELARRILDYLFAQD